MIRENRDAFARMAAPQDLTATEGWVTFRFLLQRFSKLRFSF
jgi:hypothetical protein